MLNSAHSSAFFPRQSHHPTSPISQREEQTAKSTGIQTRQQASSKGIQQLAHRPRSMRDLEQESPWLLSRGFCSGRISSGPADDGSVFPSSAGEMETDGDFSQSSWNSRSRSLQDFLPDSTVRGFPSCHSVPGMLWLVCCAWCVVFGVLCLVWQAWHAVPGLMCLVCCA